MLLNAFEHRAAALFKLTQVAEAKLQLAQLNVVQATCGLFAVTGNEGDGGATVDQVDRRLNLMHLNFDFGRDLPDDFLHV